MRLLLVLFLCLFGYSSDSLASEQWHQLADFGNFGRHRAIGIGVGNRVYAGTGHLNGSGVDTWYPDWWEYDPATNAWAQKADYIGNNGNGDQDVVAIATEALAFVGLGQIDGDRFYKYNPQTNLWTEVTGPPVIGDFNNTHAFSIGHKGYFPSLGSSTFYEYDTDTDTWTTRNPIPFSVFFGVPTFAVNGKGYIKNGADFYEYDPVADMWTAKAPFPGLYPNRPKGVSQNNYGYFIGGFAGNPSVLPWEWGVEVWRYDPSNDTWLQTEDFPGTTRRWAITAKIQDRVFYGLGTNGTNFNDFWEFNSVADIEEFDANSFLAYPSPAIDQIDFTSKDLQNFDIELFDLLGKSVGSSVSINGTARINRDKLTGGIYVYHVIHDGKSIHSDRVIFL